MNTITHTIEKRTYSLPIIERIVLDNEISLQLQSNSEPSSEPAWSQNVPEYFNNDPFKENIV